MVFNGFPCWKIHEYLQRYPSISGSKLSVFLSCQETDNGVCEGDKIPRGKFSVLCGGWWWSLDGQKQAVGKFLRLRPSREERRAIQLQFQITPSQPHHIIVNAAAQSCSLQLAWFLPIVHSRIFPPPSAFGWSEALWLAVFKLLFVLISEKDQHQHRTGLLIRAWVASACDILTWISSGWVILNLLRSSHYYEGWDPRWNVCVTSHYSQNFRNTLTLPTSPPSHGQAHRTAHSPQVWGYKYEAHQVMAASRCLRWAQ